jgi:hypothetical protein
MKSILGLFPLLFCSFLSYSQCDEFIDSEYDKFTQKNNLSIKKVLNISKVGISFTLKPKINGGYSGFDIRISNNNYYPITISQKVELIVLFTDNTTFTLFEELSFAYSLKQSEIGIFTLSFTPKNCCHTSYMAQLNNLEKSYKEHFYNKKISAIRFIGFGSSNIDYDIPVVDQDYFLKIYKCLK